MLSQPSSWLREKGILLAITQSNIQRVTVLAFAPGLPESLAQISNCISLAIEANNFFSPQAMLKRESKQMSLLIHTAPRTATRYTDTAWPPCLDKPLFPYLSPQHFQDRTKCLFLNIRLWKIIKHLPTCMLVHLVNNTKSGGGLFSVFHHLPSPNLLHNLLCLAISKHIFIMYFYSIQIAICLFH